MTGPLAETVSFCIEVRMDGELTYHGSPNDQSKAVMTDRPRNGWYRGFPAGPLALALFVLLVWGGAAAAQAQESLHLEEGRFFIETITVENERSLTSEIVVSESRLMIGQEYTESQLRDAIHRVLRLPLVLDANLSLRKGSRRGLYELVITIRESRLWFWGIDLEMVAWSEPVSVSGLTTTDTVVGSVGLIGRRFPAGRHGLFYAALGGTDGTIQLGYTHYDPFGRGGVLGLSYGWADCAPETEDGVSSSDPGDSGCQTEVLGLGLDPTYSSWSTLGYSHRARLTLGIPIEGNHSLRLLTSYRFTDLGIRRQAVDTDRRRFGRFENREDLELNFSWVFNSLDDPVFPGSGDIIEAGLDLKLMTADIRQFDLTGDAAEVVSGASSTQVAGVATGRHYWPIGDKQTLWVGGELLVGSSRVEDLPGPDLELINQNSLTWAAAASAGHGVFLTRIRDHGRWRDLRWESDLQIFSHGLGTTPASADFPGHGARISTGLTYRNTWGVMRLQVGYIALEHR